MFDKRNMTITRRAAASSGPCLADRVWLTLWPASSHAQHSPAWGPGPDLAWPMLDPGRPQCDQAGPQPETRPDTGGASAPALAAGCPGCFTLNHCLQLVVSIVWLVKTN